MIYLGQDPIGISNIPESYPELVQNVAALNEEIIAKAPVVYREASGDIVTISDGADGMPLKDCTVQIDPVQDLHGYDNPWPAGGGVNVFDIKTWVTLGNNQSYYSVSNDESITVLADDGSGIGTRLFTLQAGEVYSCTVFGNIATAKVFGSDSTTLATGSSLTFTVPSDGKVAVKLTASSYPSTGKCAIVKGSTAPTLWSPYSNICPITGHDRATVTRTGVNVWDEEWESGDYTDADGLPHTQGTRIRTKNAIRCTPLTNYYFVLPSDKFGQIFYYDINDSYISCTNWISIGQITTPANCYYIRFYLVSTTEYTNGVGINYPSTDTTYHAYQGNTYSITLPDSVGTVYSGTVDLKAKTLTVDRAIVDLGSLSWTKNNAGTEHERWSAVISNAAKFVDHSTVVNLLCSIFQSGTYPQIYNHQKDEAIGFYDSTTILVWSGVYSSFTKQEFEAALSGVQLVYELATPLTYSLTDLPTITTLPGINNIWADTGAISLTYSADTKTYIDDHTPVQDVQIGGTSILSDGVANIPLATINGETGAVRVNPAAFGIGANTSGTLYISGAGSSNIKGGVNGYKPITPDVQHQSAFYGLAKAAGVDMASSSNAVGTYTDAAKIAIQKMLGIYQAPWELIREDTFTNAEEADHIITVDGNGNAFELTDAVLLFETPQQETYSAKGLAGQSWFYYDSSNYISSECGGWTQNANTSAHTCAAELTQFDGMVRMTVVQSAVGGALAVRYSRIYPGFSPTSKAISYRFVNNSMVFNKINIKSVTGTGHYKLYGKRKWN